MNITKRRTLSVAFIWSLLVLAGGPAMAEGEDEARAGRDLYDQGDYAGAMREWRFGAEKGNTYSMYRVGSLHELGKGVKQDYTKAYRWFRKAADGDFAFAMVRLGTAYREAIGVNQDYEEAMRWFRKAADKKLKGANLSIGYLYRNGQGVEQSYVEAMRHFRIDADAGLTSAMYLVGTFYDQGLGVKQSFVEARHWFKAAAAKGHALATDQLGVLCFNGLGGPRDLDAALRDFKFANQSGPGAYTTMRIWLCLRALDRDAKATAYVAAYLSKQKVEEWPRSILGFMAGDVTEKELFSKADAEKSEDHTARMCEAYYYAGFAKLFADDRESAISYFEKCIATGQSDYIEYKSAIAELQRLRQK